MAWKFTVYGFFSVVCARLDGGRGPVDPNVFMVRVRVIEHLRNLQAAFPAELGDLVIHESVASDYCARLFVPREAWLKVALALESQIDYDNFKSAVGERHLTLPSYKDSLMSVWGVMHRLQPARRASGQGTMWEREAPKAPRMLPNSETPRRLSGLPVAGPVDLKDVPVSRSAMVVCAFSKPKRTGSLLPVCVLIDYEQYDDGRDAVRDAIANGWLAHVPRSQLSVSRNVVRWAREAKVPAISLYGVDRTTGKPVPASAAITMQWSDVPRETSQLGLLMADLRLKGVAVAMDYEHLSMLEAQDALERAVLGDRSGAAWFGEKNLNTLRGFVASGRECHTTDGVCVLPSAKLVSLRNVPSAKPKETEMEKRTHEAAVNGQASPATANRPAPLVEDTSMVGGMDEETGAPVIRPRTPSGVADSKTEATDAQERHA